MAESRAEAIRYAGEHRSEFRDELSRFLAIPSISTDSAHKNDIQAGAEWLKKRLERLGAQAAEILSTDGKPIVWGEIPAGSRGTATHSARGPEPGPGAGAVHGSRDVPTLLIYGHYDVQPVDPVEQWNSHPFTATERNGALYARGASDMKGQVVACLAALESVLATGELPLNVRFLFEGEEEIGSPSLRTSLRKHADRFRADLCLNPDTGMVDPWSPTITYALRGLAYFELHVDGPMHDLHSGLYGGVVHNPAQVLTDLISGMHDESGRITLPGFYDRVRELSERERSAFARLPNDEKFYLKQTGAPELWGEEGYTAAERVGARPTLEVHGLLSGFTGEGAKTVLPATAMAKISMRLVPDQDPKEARSQLESYLEAHTPKTVKYRLIEHASGPPLLAEPESPGNRALAEALNTAWGKEPLFKREGGSVPVATYLDEILRIPSALTGFELPDDNIHAPNEKLDLETWYRGIEALIHFYYNFAGTGNEHD